MIENLLWLVAGIFIGRTYPWVWEWIETQALWVRDWWRSRR